MIRPSLQFEDASHDDICGALVHDLEARGWEVRIEVPLEAETKGWHVYPDVLARPTPGEGLWVLFEVKSIKEASTVGAAITQIRKYHEALGETRARVLVTAFTPTWGQLRLLEHAGILWMKGSVYAFKGDPRAYGVLERGAREKPFTLDDLVRNT